MPVRVAVMPVVCVGGKLVSLSCSFYFSPPRLSGARRRRYRKAADKGVVMGHGYLRSPRLLPPWIITANKGKKRKRARQWECNFLV